MVVLGDPTLTEFKMRKCEAEVAESFKRVRPQAPPLDDASAQTAVRLHSRRETVDPAQLAALVKPRPRPALADGVALASFKVKATRLLSLLGGDDENDVAPLSPTRLRVAVMKEFSCL